MRDEEDRRRILVPSRCMRLELLLRPWRVRVREVLRDCDCDNTPGVPGTDMLERYDEGLGVLV